MELVNSHVYLQMSSYFSRDGVSLLGFALYFRKESEEKRSHAEQLVRQARWMFRVYPCYSV